MYLDPQMFPSLYSEDNLSSAFHPGQIETTIDTNAGPQITTPGMTRSVVYRLLNTHDR